METKKKKTKLVAALLALVGLLVFSLLAVGGSLEPSAPPGPTMKTLDQVEPRTPVQTLTGSATSLYVINQPGSYYLTANIAGEPNKNGIEIASDDVTLDLSGFALIGHPNSLDGVTVSGYRYNIAVLSGTVRDWGGDGVDGGVSGSAHNSLFRDLRAYDNGGHGLLIGATSLITRCTAMNNGGSGIVAWGFGSQIIACEAFGNKDINGAGITVSIGGAIINCASKSNTGKGFGGGENSRIINCTATENTGVGIYTWYGTVTGCTASGNNSDGIWVTTNCRVTDNHCYDNTGAGNKAGILVTGYRNHVEGNTVTRNQFGIKVDAANGGTFLIRNKAQSNQPGGDYVIVAGNAFGPLVTVTGVGDISGTANADHPCANFVF